MRFVAVAVLSASLLLVATASAADILIRPGASIGKLRLGMVEAEARKAYPYPYAVREARPFGRERVEMTFGLAPYSVVLYGPEGRARVVSIMTLSQAERTRDGLGVGSSEVRLRAVYGKRLVCNPPTAYNRGGEVIYNPFRSCFLRARGVETSFDLRMDADQIANSVPKWIPKRATVTRIYVYTVPQPR